MTKRIQRYSLPGTWPYLAVLACFVFGGLCGCLLGNSFSPRNAQELEFYLRDYVSFAKQGLPGQSLSQVFGNQLRWPVIYAFLGLTGIGTLLLPVVVALQGFITVFGISSFVRFFGGTGFLSSFLLFGVPALFWVPGQFLICNLSFRNSFQIFQGRRGRALTNSTPIGLFQRSILIGFFLSALCAVYEYFLLPLILPAAVSILK